MARVFVCHFMRVDNPSGLLREIADGFERLLDGSAPFRDNADSLGYPVREACFDHFSIFIAGEDSGERL